MEAVIIPIVALLIPIIIVPTALGIKHARYLREVEHLERMRAMELGRTLAEDKPWSPATIAITFGAGVPIASLLIALGAVESMHGSGPVEAVWASAGAVGLGGVIGGTFLASRLGSTKGTSGDLDRKAAFDPDAYDVAGSRG